MTEPLSDKMERFEAAVSDAAEAVRERDAIADEIGTRLAEHVETAVAESGTNVEPVGRSAAGDSFRFEARLDRAAMVASVTDALPAGFAVSHINDDGSLTVEWTGSGRTPSDRDRDAILKAIVAEETTLDGDGLVTSVPTREWVLERAAELGVAKDTAADRLSHLATLDMIDVDDGYVYPDENFSRI